DATVRLWDAATGEPRGTVSLGSLAGQMAFSPDGTRLAVVGGGYRSVGLIDVPAARFLHTVPVGDCMSVAFSPDGKALVLGTEKGVVQFRDPSGERLLLELPRVHQGGFVGSLCFAGDGQSLVTCGGDSRLCLWRVNVPGMAGFNGANPAGRVRLL